VTAFFTDLDLVPPGIVPMLDWHPAAPDDSHQVQSTRLLTTDHASTSVFYWVGLGRRPSTST
jgi:hypothetical protein